ATSTEKTSPTKSRATRTFALSQGCGYGGGWYQCPGTVPYAEYSNNQDRAFADQWFDEPVRQIGSSTYSYFSPVSEQVNAVEWTPCPTCVVAPGTTAWTSAGTFWL